MVFTSGFQKQRSPPSIENLDDRESKFSIEGSGSQEFCVSRNRHQGPIFPKGNSSIRLSESFSLP